MPYFNNAANIIKILININNPKNFKKRRKIKNMKIIALEEEFIPDSFKDMTTKVFQENKYTYEASNQIIEKDVIDAMLDLGDEHLAAMDEAGIDLQILSALIPQITTDNEALKSVIEEGNNKAAEAIKKNPTRYSAFAGLPFVDPKAALTEFEKCIKSGFVGAILYGSINGDFFDNKKYWPILEFAEANNKPIYLHPCYPVPGMINYFKGREELSGPEWGFMIDASSHFMRMLTGGVFDQFPKLKVILGHLGESIPYNMERINNRLSAYTKEKLKKSAAEYIRQNLFITTSGNFSTPSLLCAMGTIGVDNILFSVDWPNESNKKAVEFLKHLPVSEPDLEKIAYKNAIRIFNLQKY